MRSLSLRFPDGGREARGAGYALLAAGIAVLVWVLYQYQEAMEEVEYWDARVASMDRHAQRKTPMLASPLHGGRETKQEIRRANMVLNEIDLPWGALFDAVERATGRDVALLAFQPNAAARTMRMSGEAKGMPALLAFIGALEREPVLEDVYLLKYEAKHDDPQQPIVFSVMASWIEAS